MPNTAESRDAGAIVLELQPVQPALRKKVAASNVRRIIAVTEVLADVCTITLATRVGYMFYHATSIGKHMYLPLRLVGVEVPFSQQ